MHRCLPTNRSLSTTNQENNERRTNVDHPYSIVDQSQPMKSSMSTSTLHVARSSRIYIDQLRTKEYEDERRELTTLNDRFDTYIERIKSLVNINGNLRRQVNQAYRKCIADMNEQSIDTNISNNVRVDQHPLETPLNQLRQHINDNVQMQTLIDIRLQRADYDINFYRLQLTQLNDHERKQNERIRTMQQQLQSNLHELEQLKQQHHRYEDELQVKPI
jgi:hypothetical protein